VIRSAKHVPAEVDGRVADRAFDRVRYRVGVGDLAATQQPVLVIQLAAGNMSAADEALHEDVVRTLYPTEQLAGICDRFERQPRAENVGVCRRDVRSEIFLEAA